MNVVYEHPVTVEEPSPGGRWKTKTTHPAYAQIGAHRVQGKSWLYGSDFLHQSYITISIRASEVHRDLSNDWHFAKDEYISVSLSEAQWATFISALNIGHGVPCTLTDRDRKMVPQLPPPPDRSETFGREMADNLTEADGHIRQVQQLISESGLSQKKQEAIMREISMARRDIGSSVKFVCDQFGEHMEGVKEAAKAEIEGYFTGLVMRTGIKALQSQPPIVVEYKPVTQAQISGPKDPDEIQ